MGKMFSNMTTDNLESAEDRLGGSNFEPLPTGVYDVQIKTAYVGTAASSSSTSITIIGDVKGKELRETIWISTKDGNNFYPDKQDPKKKVPLPGFTTIDDICLLTTQEALADQETEEKLVKIYDPMERKELPKPVQVLTALTGKTVKLGVIRQIVDKQKKDDSGIYVNTGEFRTENTIDKAFHPETGRTVNEYRHEVETSEFLNAWLERNAGKDRNRAKGLGESAGGASGMGRPGVVPGAAPRKKLFGS